MRQLALAVALLSAAQLVSAHPTAPDSARPGAVRPGEFPPRTPARPLGAASDEEYAALLLAGGPSLPDSARPGAVRPGEERRFLPPQPGPEVFEVPRVADRPLDIDAGEKVQVSKFRIAGAQDRPELGISVAEVEALAEQMRAQRPEGFTVGRLQEVAEAVTKYYRSKGLILAQAYVPVQTVEQGVVTLQVLEGRLGRVLLEGNKRYSSEALTRPFEDLVGQPVTKAATEAALLHLSDYPGLGLFGVFQPGQMVGTADMVLKVQKEDRFDGSLRYDNHGLPETGRRRGRVEVSWNNPTGHADKLTLTAQVTHVPANLLYWGVDYETQLFSPENRVQVGFNRNVFDVGEEFEDREISSFTENAHASFTRSLLRSRLLNLSASLGLERKQAITHQLFADVSRDDLAVLSAGLDFNRVDTRFAGLDSAQVEVSRGFASVLGAMGGHNEVNTARPNNRPSRRGGSGDFATGNFYKVYFSGSRLQSLAPLGKLFNRPNLFAGHQLLLRAEGQWSPSLLVPLEQYSIGGPTHVRAYGPTERLMDMALFFSTEWIINAPGIADKPAFGGKTWGELIQLSFFYDVAFGRLNDPTKQQVRDGTDTENFNGAGLSLSFAYPDRFASRVTFANPLGGPRPANDRSPQVWIDLNYLF